MRLTGATWAASSNRFPKVGVMIYEYEGEARHIPQGYSCFGTLCALLIAKGLIAQG
jgi:hypothetical protein